MVYTRYQIAFLVYTEENNVLTAMFSTRFAYENIFQAS